ncbi:YqcI/YcgG family protein [Streptomyces sp. NPDC057521]|uniref:YqcI/YcgG family protein n=1 Tax=Streptomyces sp. NPDC057521 TaxID=3346156 RepID=UPI0036A5C4D8
MITRASDVLGRDDDLSHRLASHIAEFSQFVAAREFPCTFATRALAGDELLFGLSSGESRLESVLSLMREAAQAIRRAPEQVVVIFVDQDTDATLADDRELAAQIMAYLVQHDATPWPAGAPTDPNHPHWTFWFEGVDFFLNFSTPGHERRRSRNLGSAVTLVVQSRSSFDPYSGDAVRARIRSRVATYDGLPAHPALETYGNPSNREMYQFFLGDANDEFVDLLAEPDQRLSTDSSHLSQGTHDD